MNEKARPLIFFEEDVGKAIALLEPFLKRTRTRANLLMDNEGHAFAQVGDPKIPLETISAFVAASIAATRQVGKIVQADELLTLTHPGKSSSIQLTTIREGAVLVTVFDARTTVGAIVFFLRELVGALGAIVDEVAKRKGKPVDLGAGFDDAAAGALDDVFGEGN